MVHSLTWKCRSQMRVKYLLRVCSILKIFSFHFAIANGNNSLYDIRMHWIDEMCNKLVLVCMTLHFVYFHKVLFHSELKIYLGRYFLFSKSLNR